MRSIRFKRLTSLILSVLMLLTVLPFGAISVSAQETDKYLSDMEHTEFSDVGGQFWTNSNIVIGTEAFEKGIHMHPSYIGADYAASVTYDISGLNVNRFSAYVGKDQGGESYGNNPVKFEVYADSTLIGSSAELQYPNKEFMDITVPYGTSSLKILAIATGPNGDSYYSCGSTVASPKIYMNDSVEVTHLTSLPYESLICLFGESDPTTTTVEGEFRYNNDINIGTLLYDKGVYLHPINAYDKASVTYDISRGEYSKFQTFVGKDRGGAAWDNQPVTFEILIDGVSVAKAESMQYPDVKLLECTIPADAEKLTLQVTAINAHSATGSCFGSPVLLSGEESTDTVYASQLNITSYDDFFAVYNVSNGATEISLGGGAYKSTFGFQNHPYQDTAADINIDISGLGYTHFSTVVGKVDIGGEGFDFIILVDDVVVAEKKGLIGTEVAALECNIPENAQKLTLRVIGSEGNYFNGLAGFCDPILTKEAPPEEEKLKPESATLSLSDDIAVRYYIKKSVVDQYTDLTLNVKTSYTGEISLTGSNIIKDFGEGPTEYTVFTFEGVTPSKMAENIETTLVGTKNGETVTGETVNYSPAIYCANKISSATESDNVKAVCMELLQYCSAVQNFVDYEGTKIDASGITSEINYSESFANVFNIANTENIKVKSAGLFLNSAITARFTVQSADPISATVDGEALQVVDNGNGIYYVYYNAKSITDYAKDINLTVTDGTQTATLKYSVATYALRQINKFGTSDGIGAVCDSLLQYIQSVKNLTA